MIDADRLLMELHAVLRNAGSISFVTGTYKDQLVRRIEERLSAPPEAPCITENDKRWRILEHGCQWVSWTPIGGETHSFDPRDVEHLKRMRAWADETIEKHLAILRDGISARSPLARRQEEKS